LKKNELFKNHFKASKKKNKNNNISNIVILNLQR